MWKKTLLLCCSILLLICWKILHGLAYTHKPKYLACITVCWNLSIRKTISLIDLLKSIHWKHPRPTTLTQHPLDHPTLIGWRNLFIILNMLNHCLLWSLHAFTSSMQTTFHIFSNWVLNIFNMSILIAPSFCTQNLNQKLCPEEGNSSLLLTPKFYSLTHHKLPILCYLQQINFEFSSKFHL